jgi:hypothetical protein
LDSDELDEEKKDRVKRVSIRYRRNLKSFEIMDSRRDSDKRCGRSCRERGIRSRPALLLSYERSWVMRENSSSWLYKSYSWMLAQLLSGNNNDGEESDVARGPE